MTLSRVQTTMDADQTDRIHRLVCALVGRMQQNKAQLGAGVGGGLNLLWSVS